MTMQRRTFLKASASALMSAPALTFAANAATGSTIITAVSNPGAKYVPFYVADKAGIAKQEGLIVESIMISSGAGVRDAVAADRAQFALAQGNSAAIATGKGRPGKTIMSLLWGAPDGFIVVRKDLYDEGIDTVPKLAEWKRPDGSKPLIVATSKGSGSYILGALVLKSFGVFDKFGWIFAGGGTSQVLALLKSKQVDAIVADPNWQGAAEAGGFGHLIFDILTPENTKKVIGGPFMGTVVFGLDSTLRDKALTQAYVNAIYRSMQWIKSHSEDEAWALLEGNYFSQLDAAITKNEMAVYKRVWNYDGFVTPEVYETSRKLYKDPAYDTPDMTYAEVVDMSFVEAAKKEFG
jgi:NitT/TauT family transport system substrate-binding protein